MAPTRAEKEASLLRAKMWSQSRRAPSTPKLTPASRNDKVNDKDKKSTPQARATRSQGKKNKKTVTVEEPNVKQEETELLYIYHKTPNRSSSKEAPLYRKTPSRSSRDEARAKAQAWAAARRNKGEGADRKVQAEEAAVTDEEMDTVMGDIPAVITTNNSNPVEDDAMDEDFKTVPAAIAKTSVTLKAQDLEELNRITTDLHHACGRLAKIGRHES
mmetsp:Transcript_27555/g.65538  ORF Transcript_27555/g.65538 Transcript_27555/m.65538 type:complete len:216 (+) Transcript_27555:2203-2850(+)